LSYGTKSVLYILFLNLILIPFLAVAHQRVLDIAQ